MDGLSSRSDTAEEKVTELKDIAIQTIQNEAQRKKWLKSKQSLSVLWTMSNSLTERGEKNY